MRPSSLLHHLFFLVALTAFPASATVLTFDDLPPQQFITEYAGFHWGGYNGSVTWVLETIYNSDYIKNTTGPLSHSGEHFVWTNGGVTGTVSSDQPFNLNSFWARHLGYSQSTAPLTYEVWAYRDDVEVYREAFTVTNEYSHIVLNFNNIDKWEMTHGNMIAFDDIVVSRVPEPSALGLLGLGLLGIWAARSRRLPFGRQMT